MIDALVTDCATFHDCVPALAVPHLDTEVRDMLSIVQPLHGQSVIESQRPCEIGFENGLVRTARRGPEGAGIAIECGLGGAVGANVLFCDQIFSVPSVNGRTEFHEAPGIRFGQQTSPVRSEAEHQLATASDGVFVDGDQFWNRL